MRGNLGLHYKDFVTRINYRLHPRKYSSRTEEQPKPFKSIPGLSSLPVIGSLHHFLPLIGSIGMKVNFYELTETLYKKFGPIVKLEGVFNRADMVILYEPEQFDQVYRAEEVAALRPGFDTMDYYRSNLRKSTYDGVYGLLTAQGPQWRDFRTKVNPALLKPKIMKLYAPGLEQIAEDVVTRIDKIRDNEKYLNENLDLEITKWSLESVALIGLGTRLGCLRDDLDEDHPARQLIKCSKDIFELSYKLEFLPSLWRYISTPNFKKLMKTYDKQWEISEMYIKQAKREISDREHEVPEEEKSVIEKLIAIDERVATMMANEMLLAGIDTAAFGAVNVLYRLASNPNVQNKLRTEIRSGESKNRYLKACIKEALRLLPVISANLRRASRDHIVQGYLIPKGTDIIAPNEFLALMEKNYTQATQFIPERWLVDKTDPLHYGKAHPMINAPFGFGVRSCIGRRIAELEIELLISKLIDAFQVAWIGPPVKVVTKASNSFAKPYHFTFKPTK